MHNFKLAAKNSFLFLLCANLLTAGFLFPYFHTETYHYQDAYVRDSLAGQIDTLIVGASQAQRGIDPHVLNEALDCFAYNLSTPLLTFEAKYTLLKKELDRNPVRLVLFEICYDSLARDRAVVGPEGDFYMLGRLNDPIERLTYFFRCARIDEYGVFYNDTLTRGSYTWGKLIRGENKIGTSPSYDTLGYAPLQANPIEPIDPSLYHAEAILTTVGEENLYYLEKMFALCRDRSIPVILLATPLADAAILSYDALDVIRTRHADLAAAYDCPYYDFSLYRGKSTLFPDETAFFDRNHLSASGAATFSAILAACIADPPASPELLFYDSYAVLDTVLTAGN